MTFFLDKKIIFKKNKNIQDNIKISIFGELIGWTDGDKKIDCSDIEKTIKDVWEKNGETSMKNFMKGIVGPCVIEVSTANEVLLFASCASGGFYWIKMLDKFTDEEIYLISNNEGSFMRRALEFSKSISEGALMNALVSHQALIRPLFKGLVSKTMRCPPGFYVKFSFSKFNLQTYLIETEQKKRKQQDITIKKKMEAIAFLYKNYSEKFDMKIKVAFSGGVDSTALMIVHNSGLDVSSNGFYSNRNKLNELKMAKEMSNRLNVRVDIIDPFDNFSYDEIKKRASVGLSMLNGIPYLKQGFQFSPYKNENKRNMIITGQNSDTLFHIDTKAPSSFTTGIIRLIKMSGGLKARFQTTMLYYKLKHILNKDNITRELLPTIKNTYYTLNEHGGDDKVLHKNIKTILFQYKKLNYIQPLQNWFKKEFYPRLNNSTLNTSEKLNHAARFASWLRTIGNFHQGFFNISSYEKILICVPYSEGPMASELLSYRLGLKDILYPKIFLHTFIKDKLGISYNKIRIKTLGGGLISLPFEIIFFSSKLLIRLIKKIFKNNNIFKVRRINKKEISNLRKILIDKDGNIDRILLNYINDIECKKYLNYLYDCLDLKIDSGSINNISGMHLCRLVNLQIMLFETKE